MGIGGPVAAFIATEEVLQGATWAQNNFRIAVEE